MSATALLRRYYYSDASVSPVVLCAGNTVGVELDLAVNDTYGLVQALGNGTIAQVSQSFLTAAGWTAGGACFHLAKVGSPTGSFTIAIRAHTGTYGSSSEPTGADLVASLEYDVAGVSGSRTRYWFDFISDLGLTDATHYTLVVDGTGISGGAGDFLAVHADDVAGHDGNAATYNGSVWAVQSIQDFEFSLYGTDAGSDSVGGAMNTRSRSGRNRWGGV
jgi:hypothetical protein